MTASLARVPAVPAPPHDPTSLLLNGRVGWRMTWANGVEIADGTVQLVPLASSLPSMANAAGTFGNLTLPSNVTVTDDGMILLLDTARLKLRRFDPCACEFRDVRGIGGPGVPPRHWDSAHAIAARGRDLYVCDTGHERVAIYTLYGLAFRGALRPPVVDYPRWHPYAIAFDRRGRAFVTDQAAGLVHVFDAYGVWRRAIAGFSQPTAIAVDCGGRVFVAQPGAAGPEIRVVDADGTPIDVAPRADVLAQDFPPVAVEVDTSGNVRPGPLCRPPDACDGDTAARDWFDASGNPLAAAPPALTPLYTGSGEFVTGPLDSRIADCIWHRIVLAGVVPDDAKVLVETFTSDEEWSSDQVQTLATWATGQTARRVDRTWDCLVRSGAGRRLWLKLTLTSMGGGTPRIDAITIEFPRVSLRRYLPAIFGAEPTSADFTDRFTSIFDTTLRSIERQVDTEASLFDPLSSPAARVNGSQVDFLTWLGSWVGLSLDRRMPEKRRRLLLKRAGALFDWRGTLRGLREQLSLVLGFERIAGRCCPEPPRCRCCPPPLNCAPEPPPIEWERPPLVLEHFKLRRWLYVGRGRLGSEAVLWGSRIVNRSELDVNAQVAVSKLISTQDPLRDPHHVFAHKFSVFVPCNYRTNDADRRALEQLLRTESPAHTEHQLVFVEPRFRIGVQSMLGFDAVVAGVPQGVRLGSDPLGEATVLTSGTGSRPALGGARVGTTGRLG